MLGIFSRRIESDLHDHGDLRRIEELSTEIAKTMDLLRVAFDAAPDGLVASNGDGRVLLANRTAEKMFGYASLEGVSVDDLVPERLRSSHQAHRESYIATVRGEGPCMTIDRRPVPCLRQDGTEFEAWIGLNAVRGTTSGAVLVIVSVSVHG